MEQKTAPTRSYLRIPVNLAAKIFSQGRLLKNVRLFDLSISGSSFAVRQADEVPEIFELRFKLGYFSKVLKVQAQVKNTFEKAGRLRVGCIFLGLSKADQEILDRFLCQAVDIAAPTGLIGITAFFCLIDGGIRMFIQAMLLHYRVSQLGQDLHIGGSAIILAVYVLSSALAFLLSPRMKNNADKVKFLLSIFFLIPGLIFLSFKAALYTQSGIFSCPYPLIRLMAGLTFFLLFLLVASLLLGLTSLPKINTALSILQQHQSHTAPLVNPKKAKKERDIHELS